MNKGLKLKINNNQLLLIVGGVIIAFLLLILLVSKGKTLTCKIDNELIEGFNNKEIVVFKLKKNKIDTVKYDRVISLNDYYAKYGTYIESLHSVFDGGYNYIDDKKITDKESSIELSFKTKKEGIVLDNLHIKYNSELENTSLRYDTDTSSDSENAFKVGDEYKKADLKKKVESLGYSCK